MDILTIVIAIIFFVLTVFGKRLSNASRNAGRPARAAPAARPRTETTSAPTLQQLMQPHATTQHSSASAPGMQPAPSGQDPAFRAAGLLLALVLVAIVAVIALGAAWLIYLQGAPAG